MIVRLTVDIMYVDVEHNPLPRLAIPTNLAMLEFQDMVNSNILSKVEYNNVVSDGCLRNSLVSIYILS